MLRKPLHLLLLLLLSGLHVDGWLYLEANHSYLFRDRLVAVNKLNALLNENADLKEQLGQIQQDHRDYAQKLPDEKKLRKKLVDAMMELMATKPGNDFVPFPHNIE